MTNVCVRCEQLVKRYENKAALDHLTVEIPMHRIVGILGPNGCGKSTFFRTMTGLVAPDSGHIEVLGRKPGWATNRDIAYLPDRARWYPNHTVEKALKWADAFLPGFDMEAARRLADFMELDMDLKVNGMSRGQEARLMLLLCLSREVPLVILDEPFLGIDVLSREQIIEGLIDFLEDREQTILISTHEIHEVEGLFDYAVFIDRGRVILSGETEALRAEHGSLRDIFKTFYKRRLKR